MRIPPCGDNILPSTLQSPSGGEDGIPTRRHGVLGGADHRRRAGRSDLRADKSLAAGYVDPLLGGGFGNIASYLVLIAVLFVRPYGLFGEADLERV